MYVHQNRRHSLTYTEQCEMSEIVSRIEKFNVTLLFTAQGGERVVNERQERMIYNPRIDHLYCHVAQRRLTPRIADNNRLTAPLTTVHGHAVA